MPKETRQDQNDKGVGGGRRGWHNRQGGKGGGARGWKVAVQHGSDGGCNSPNVQHHGWTCNLSHAVEPLRAGGCRPTERPTAGSTCTATA